MSSDLPSLGVGIEFVEGVGNWLRGVGIRAGLVPIGWDHDKRPGLVWRIPDRTIPSASVFTNVQGVLVREFEQAIVLHNGTFYAELPAGIYDVRKLPLKDFMEIIWVSTQETQHKWGVGRVINKENITLGAHGLIFLQVVDARKFVTRVVAGNRKYTQEDLEEWVFSIVSGVMRTQVAATAIADLMQGQEEFAHACSQRLAQVFDEWGIGFKNLVVNQFDVPQEYRDTIAKVTLEKFKRDTTVISAEAEAEALRIRSRAEAEARLTTGSAEAQLMGQFLRLGLDPMRLKAIEALTQYSQLAAQTGGGADSGSDMVKMMLFMQMSRLLTDPGMPPEAKNLLTAQFPAEAAQVARLPATAESAIPLQSPEQPAAADVAGSPAAPPAPAEPAAQPAATLSERERIQQTLDNLDERLASGEISEATYDRLRAKWEQKLDTLETTS